MRPKTLEIKIDENYLGLLATLGEVASRKIALEQITDVIEMNRFQIKSNTMSNN